MTSLNMVPMPREGDIAVIVLEMNFSSASERSPLLLRLRANGAETSYLESRSKDVVAPHINALSRSLRSTPVVVAWYRSGGGRAAL